MERNKADDWKLLFRVYSSSWNYKHCFSKTFLFNLNRSVNCLLLLCRPRRLEGKGMARESKWKITKTRNRTGELKWWIRSQTNEQTGGKPLDVNVFIMRKWKVDTLNVVINFPPSTQPRDLRWCLCIHEDSRSPIEAFRGVDERRHGGRRRRKAKKASRNQFWLERQSESESSSLYDVITL